MSFRKRKPPPGARPGTLVLDAKAPPPRIHVFHYTVDDTTEVDAVRVEDLAAHRERPGVLWVDVQGLGDETILRSIAELFEIHRLALEDVVHVPQRPKTETYEHHQFYISRQVQMRDGGLVESEQFSVFFGEGYVLTFQETHGDILEPVRRRIRQGKGPIRRSGADYLAYALIDTLIDGLYPVLESMGEVLEDLENEVIVTATPATLRQVNRIKRDLLMLRRTIWPQRDAVNALIRDDSPFVSEGVRVYLRDCYDHCVQLADVLETYRELAGGLLNTYLSSVSNRTNDVMKVLTIMASIFIPLTFMAGIYGMNFDAMPELKWPWGYPVLILLMVMVTVCMLFYFRHLGWIGRPHAADADDADGP
ncbi:MAG: magnesium/cobalt transporter CorA [Planctomycetota bacterium]|jgi:magnesium transporter